METKKSLRQNKIWCNQTPSIVFTIKKRWHEHVGSYNDYSMCEIKGKSTASGVRDTIHKKLYKKLIISLYSYSMKHV